MSRTLYEIIGDIDDELILDAEKLSPRKRGGPIGVWGAAAAACLALLIIPFALSGGNSSPDMISVPEHTEQTTHTQLEQQDGGSMPEAPPEEVAAARFNDADIGLGGNMLFDLSGEYYVPMTWEELFDYYPADISYDELVELFCGLFPRYSVRCGENAAIYVSDNGIPFYDANTVVFENREGGSIGLTFANAFIMGANILPLSERLEFTEINGRQQALFRLADYLADYDGKEKMYTEFLRGETGVFILAANIPEEEFVKAVSALLPPAEEEREIYSVEGTLTAIDSYAGYIGVSTGEWGYGVYLPEGEAEKYSLYDRVRVTYTGEPAQIRRIWRQQLQSIELIE